MVDVLIIRNKFDLATDYTNWIGEGLKAYLESKGCSVTDLSDAQATPENVAYWLNYTDSRTKKLVIAFDHGSCIAFYGEKNNSIAEVINKNNAGLMTKELHVYTLACSTNGNNCVGQTAIENGCLSWLGYIEPVYAMKSDSFKECIWSYIEALVAGKTLEQCEAVLKKAYEDRKDLSFVFGYNLDRLLLRKSQNNMTMNSNNRSAKWQINQKVDGLWANGPENRNVWVHFKGLGWKKICPEHDSQVEAIATMATHAKADDRNVSFYEQDNQIKQIYVW